MKAILQVFNRVKLIYQIMIGLVIGISVALINPAVGKDLSLLGIIFVGALKGIAPLLVFFLVIAAVCRHRADQKTGMKKNHRHVYGRHVLISINCCFCQLPLPGHSTFSDCS